MHQTASTSPDDLSANEKLALTALAHAGPHYTLGTLAADTGLAIDTAVNVVASLRQKGLIEVDL